MTTQELKAISMDTLNLISQPMYSVNGITYNMRDIVMTSVNNTKFYSHEEKIVATSNNSFNTEYYVVNKKTTSVVEDIYNEGYGNMKIGVLNFASAIKAGGGWLNGKIAQEEDIMRKTTAFPALVKQDAYYSSHSKDIPIYSDAIIYTPRVAVIKDENFNNISPIFMNLYTCAAIDKTSCEKNVIIMKKAVDYFTASGRALFIDFMIQRIRKILSCMAENGEEILVLGAFGCGVFGNSPEHIATIFSNLLQLEFGKYFRKVYFAVYDTSANQENFNAFESKFK